MKKKNKYDAIEKLIEVSEKCITGCDLDAPSPCHCRKNVIKLLKEEFSLDYKVYEEARKTRPLWLDMMERSKTTKDWIVTSIHYEDTAKAVRDAFCPGAKVGDMIVVAILKRGRKK